MDELLKSLFTTGATPAVLIGLAVYAVRSLRPLVNTLVERHVQYLDRTASSAEATAKSMLAMTTGIDETRKILEARALKLDTIHDDVGIIKDKLSSICKVQA